MKRLSNLHAMAAIVALAFASTVNAAAISGSIREGFVYPDGTQFPNPSTLNGGTGWNVTGSSGNPNTAVWAATGVQGGYGGVAANKTVTSPGLTSTATGYANGVGGKLTMDAQTAGAATQQVARALGGQTINEGTVYFSFLMSKSGTETPRTMNIALFGGGSERVGIGQFGTGATGTSNGNIAVVFLNSNPTNLFYPGFNSVPGTPIAMGVGQTHLIVGRVDWNAAGNETFTMWVDPANVTTEALAGTPYVTSSAFELVSFESVRPFVGNAATVATVPVSGVLGNFDQIRFSGTWAGVTTAVPEPGSALLLALSGLALGMFRKR